MKGGSNKKRKKKEEEERVVKRGRRKGREKGGGNKREKEEEKKFVHEERTNDNNDEPNIDPVKPVRLPSLYSPRAPLLSTSFSPRASIFTPSFQLSLSLSFERAEAWIPTTAALSWNALGTDDFFECGPKIAHGNNYCGGFLLKITDL